MTADINKHISTRNSKNWPFKKNSEKVQKNSLRFTLSGASHTILNSMEMGKLQIRISEIRMRPGQNNNRNRKHDTRALPSLDAYCLFSQGWS